MNRSDAATPGTGDERHIATGVPASDAHTIDALRVFSRQLVRELGYLRSPLGNSDLSPSAVHAIIEIGLNPGIQARDLAATLRLDKSNTSRQVAKLEAEGVVSRVPVPGDARASELHLTATGEALRQKIDAFGIEQVARVLNRLHKSDQESLLRFLSLYASTLSQNNAASFDARADMAGDIVRGYRPGTVGDILALFVRGYGQTTASQASFECQEARALASFVATLPAKGKEIWRYVEAGRTLGAIAVEGDTARSVARLCWFVVDPALRGAGVGRRLLTEALAYADQYCAVCTITFSSEEVEASRHLYESVGFVEVRASIDASQANSQRQWHFQRQIQVRQIGRGSTSDKNRSQ